jgi:putative transposase
LEYCSWNIVGVVRALLVNTQKRKFAARSEDWRHGQRQAAMATKKKKRHSKVEIATKLARANELATQGKLQSEIARTLGVSVMTLHRWRTALPGPQRTLQGSPQMTEPDRKRDTGDRIAELQLENSRLRQLVTDLLLEKLKLEEAAQGQKRPRDGARRVYR